MGRPPALMDSKMNFLAGMDRIQWYCNTGAGDRSARPMLVQKTLLRMLGAEVPRV